MLPFTWNFGIGRKKVGMCVIDEKKNYHAQMNKINFRWVLKTRIKEELIPPWMLKKKFSKAKWWKKRKIVFY